MALKFIPVELKKFSKNLFGAVGMGTVANGGQFRLKHKTIAKSIRITGSPVKWASDNRSSAVFYCL
jgi:hypothetical protein